MTALGGAYIASAEGVEGAAVNSASPAVRDTFSTSWVDYDVALSASLLAKVLPNNFSQLENAGPAEQVLNNETGGFVELTVGANVQLGTFGVTATADLQQFTLSSGTPSQVGSAPPQSLTMQVGRWKALGAFALLDGQLVVGGGIRAITLLISPEAGGNAGSILTTSGVGAEAGALLMPHDQPWRIGATLRGPVINGPFGSPVDNTNGVRTADSFVLPSNVALPWEAEAGVAYQLGPRPLNPRWINPHDDEASIRSQIEAARGERARQQAAELGRIAPAERQSTRSRQERDEKAARALEDEQLAVESRRLRAQRKARYANWPREKILILASVLVTGTSSNAVSLEGFLTKTNEAVGKSATLTPRVGIEGEPISNLLRARFGSYLEPSRYADGSPRQHFTFGGDVKLFPTDLWGVIVPTTLSFGLYADFAPRYSNGGIAIGVWHRRVARQFNWFLSAGSVPSFSRKTAVTSRSNADVSSSDIASSEPAARSTLRW